MNLKLIFIILLALPWSAYPQEEHQLIDLDSDQEKESKLGYDLEKGKFEFHLRTYYMQTQNKGALTDYSTLASGAGLGYSSPVWKGFNLGFSGFFVFRMFEENLALADPITGAGNRYEILHYDMHDTGNTKDLDRLEELFVTYRRNGFKSVFGRQKINSPLLNAQDNRMRPNIFNGLTVTHQKGKWESTVAWLTSVTIRGTVDWFRVEDSFGIYPFGRNPYGEPSGYKGNINSKGIGMLGLKYRNEDLSLQGWNYLAHNVFSISFIQGDYRKPAGPVDWQFGLQGFYQSALNDGGNSDPQKTYILPIERSFGFGGKWGLVAGRHDVSVNYLGISDNGRFLFPREWGRENFYSSLPRERFEGSAGVNALTFKYNWNMPADGWKTTFGLAKVDHKDLEMYSANKYGIPSYYHITGLVDYRFKGYLDGLDTQVLVVHKKAQKPSSVPDFYRINRVDLWNLNLIMDYRF